MSSTRPSPARRQNSAVAMPITPPPITSTSGWRSRPSGTPGSSVAWSAGSTVADHSVGCPTRAPLGVHDRFAAFVDVFASMVIVHSAGHHDGVPQEECLWLLGSSGPPDPWCAERHHGWLGQESAHLLQLLLGGVEADLEPLDLAEPAPLVGLVEAVLQVGDDGQQAGLLEWVGVQHRAADAGVLVAAGGAVGPRAGAKLDLASGEVLLEFGPLGRGWLAVFLTGPLGAASRDEGAMMVDHVLVV